MEYLILGLVVIIAVLLVIHHFIRKRWTKRKIEQIREAWGKPKTDSFYFEIIKKYADAVKENEFHRLTDQTIEDIDFYGLFAFIDRTTSRVGQQFLFKKVLEPANNVDVRSEELIELFNKDSNLREEIQLQLLKLSSDDAYYISSLLKEELLKKPKWFNLLYLDVIILSGLLILSFKFPVLLIFLLMPVALNLFLHYWNKNKTFQFIRSFPQLSLLIDVSNVLIKKRDLFYKKPVEESVSNLRSFQRKVRLIKFEGDEGIQAELTLLGTYLLELIKAIFLIEIFTLYRATKELETKQQSIITLFNYIGNIDSLLSIASLRAAELKTCRPLLIAPTKELVAKKMYHPLIQDCVVNDLSIIGKSILISGSNMSGKSTFLRTLTINSILAQTINTCFAEEFISSALKQFTSIKINDNLFEGKSYYFQEVNVIASLLEQADLPHQNLFILDEVFKGTNTVERIAAAKAILSYLNRNNNIVVVSTHDIELAQMLDHEYDLYHFTETVENNELHFDHSIKKGQLKTSNAIKILELSNYPKDIVSEARQISATIRKVKVMGVQSDCDTHL